MHSVSRPQTALQSAAGLHPPLKSPPHPPPTPTPYPCPHTHKPHLTPPRAPPVPRRVVTESCFATQQCGLYEALSLAKPVISIEYCDAAVVSPALHCLLAASSGPALRAAWVLLGEPGRSPGGLGAGPGRVVSGARQQAWLPRAVERSGAALKAGRGPGTRPQRQLGWRCCLHMGAQSVPHTEHPKHVPALPACSWGQPRRTRPASAPAPWQRAGTKC